MKDMKSMKVRKGRRRVFSLHALRALHGNPETDVWKFLA
jgi:hypothetical protein